ncbi:hypothetical protein FQN60_012200 [Etheostoma spectabile]|uniref:BBSome-interacting protein 1 n=1 Tax=Etheostoma spectabile TaxID=54343 RepID=A0A5J5DNY7_9PERO|nr:hypothetical protein FQN60_012200 [Etheostoma spectabile]
MDLLERSSLIEFSSRHLLSSLITSALLDFLRVPGAGFGRFIVLSTEKATPGVELLARAERLSDADRPVRREFDREGKSLLQPAKREADTQREQPVKHSEDTMPEVKSIFREVLPKTGQLSMEDVPTMVLCKPKLLPLKSVTLEKLEKMQMEAQEAVKQQELAMKEQLQ